MLDNGSWLRTINIGTNGKGMTEAYSKASAYGELMERIQNGVLLLEVEPMPKVPLLILRRFQIPAFLSSSSTSLCTTRFIFCFFYLFKKSIFALYETDSSPSAEIGCKETFNSG